jgi:hypothetical protein
VTQKLLRIADEHWVTFDGPAALRGVDPLELPFDRFLNAVHHFAIKDGQPDAVRKFETRLWMPPPGVVATRGPWSAEAETQAFKALKAGLGNAKAPAAPE